MTSSRPPTKALNGRKMTAQGKATCRAEAQWRRERRPGFASPENSQTLKGGHNSRFGLAWAMRPFCFALTGLDLFLADAPRALPWAVILRPVGAGKGDASMLFPTPAYGVRAGRNPPQPFRKGGTL
jgi:hypothetical protein